MPELQTLSKHTIKVHAKALYDETNEICEALKESAPGDVLMESVNWADFGCTDVKFTIDMEGNCGWRVVISEASPTAYRTMSHIYSKLNEKWQNIEVSLEW